MKYTPEQIALREHVSSKKNRHIDTRPVEIVADPQTGQRYFTDVLGNDINVYKGSHRNRSKYAPK